jgi:hypothetical protein
MKTILEVRIGSGEHKPKLCKDAGGQWYVVAEVDQHVGYGRGVWVRSFRSKDRVPKDGKGFLVGPTGKLIKG